MEIIGIVAAILQSFAISLGVGSSTLAIVNFFVAIADGQIDPAERRMMGNVYVTLRVSMVVIFFTLVILTAYNTFHLGISAFNDYLFAEWIVVTVLYLNAILMTLKIMPSTFGPAIQAGSWYSLGTIAAFVPVGLADFTLFQFLLGYISMIILATAIVNGGMAILKDFRKKQTANATVS